MKAKILEVRDRMTFIPMLCVDMNSDNGEERDLLRRLGYRLTGAPNIVITPANANGVGASNDPYRWADRTYTVAHHHIIDNWDSLQPGDVVDVEFILGEKSEPCLSVKAEGW